LPERRDDWHRNAHAVRGPGPVHDARGAKDDAGVVRYFLMKARFLAAAAVPLILAVATAPAWCVPASDTTATVKEDARTAGHAVAHGATTVGHTVADKSREAGHAIANGTRSARNSVRDDSKRAGHAIADGARNVGRTVREGMQKLKDGMTGKPSKPAPSG
jgi:hypothetical protein